MTRLFLFVVILLPVFTTCNSKINSRGIRLELKRQKTPLEQYINAPKYGLNVDWLYKRPISDKRTNDSIALKRYLDNEFYGQIVIGKPGKTMNVAFDTAWSVSWVLSAKCSSWIQFGCYFHNKYDETKSSSYFPNGRGFTRKEADGEVYKGFYSYDNISIAHSNVTNQSFVEMTSVPDTFIFSKIDGVLALGQKFNDSYQPFFYTLLEQKKISQPIFCIYFNRDRQSDKGGNIILGFIEKRHIHSHRDDNNNKIYDEVTYLSVEPGLLWQFKVDQILLNDSKTPLTVCEKACEGIVDSSSNSILGSTKMVNQIHNIIKARWLLYNRYMVNCDTINKLPDLIITLGGKDFVLKGRDYVIQMTHFGYSLCLSAFVPIDSLPSNYWVLGGAFLAEVYTIYNIEDKTIGFVKAA